MENEIWRKVIGYEDYLVSNFGRIKSLKYNKERIVKLSIRKNGYVCLHLSFKSNIKTRNVHQLVAESFLNHIPCGMKLVVNHIDRNRQNNNLCNLEIITNKENTSKKR